MVLTSITRLAALVLALLACTPLYAAESALAQPLPKENDRALWVSFGFLSRHDNRHANYNERNDGFGVEYQSSAEHWWSVGHYRNSVRHSSTYLQYGWMPLSFGPVRIGGAVGLVNGYPRLNGGDWTPTLLPVIGVEYGRVGANIVYIPSVAGQAAGAVAVQFKLRLF
ncbi:MAG TPA: hypothetical protein VFS42_07540 [Burkholderiaceae bacterium]|nr:hypothetical protein [Burkholderiaceae bacterium]